METYLQQEVEGDFPYIFRKPAGLVCAMVGQSYTRHQARGCKPQANCSQEPQFDGVPFIESRSFVARVDTDVLYTQQQRKYAFCSA